MNDKKYDAFISYRHLPLDKAVAKQLQLLLEHLKVPKGISCANTNKISRIFRDESELPTSSDLGNDIQNALEQSEYLIILCSSKLKESKWCLQEIEYFKSLHGGRTDKILPVLIDGNPDEVFPDALRYDIRTVTTEDGKQQSMQVEVEPLALADRSRQMVSSGDKTLGLLLALEALPRDLEKPEKPFTKEAQWALFESLASETAGLQIVDNSFIELTDERDSNISEGFLSAQSQDGSLQAYFDFSQNGYIKNSLTGQSVNFVTDLDFSWDSTRFGLTFASFSQDGEYLLAAVGGLGVRVYRTNDGYEIYRGGNSSIIGTDEWPPRKGILSNDGRLLFLGYDDGKLVIIDISSGSEYQFSGHIQRITGLAFSKDGKYFLSASFNDKVFIWDVNNISLSPYSGQLAANPSFSYSGFPVVSSCFDDNNNIVLGTNTNKNFVLTNPYTTSNDNSHVFFGSNLVQVLYSQDNDKIYMRTYDNSIMVYDMTASETKLIMSESANIRRIISNDGKYIVEIDDNNMSLYTIDRELLNTCKIQDPDISLSSAFQYQPLSNLFEDQYLVIAGTSIHENTYILDVKTGEIIEMISAMLGGASLIEERVAYVAAGVNISNDCKYFIYDGYVYKTGLDKPVMELPPDLIEYTDSGFTPDSSSFYILNDDYYAFYNIINDETILNTKFSQGVPRIISDNGKFAAGFTNEKAYIWDASTGKLISELLLLEMEQIGTIPNGSALEGNYITDGVFVEDEKIFITILNTGSLLFWDIETGKVMARLSPLIRDYNQLYVAKGQLLLCSERNIRRIDYNIETLVSQAKNMLNDRELSPAERSANYCEVKQ